MPNDCTIQDKARRLSALQRAEIRAAEAVAHARSLQTDIELLRAYILNDPKFQGYEADGSRKDWISTGDLEKRLQTIAAMGWAASDKARGEATRAAEQANRDAIQRRQERRGDAVQAGWARLEAACLMT